MFLKLDNKLVINKDVTQSPNLCDRFTEKDLTAIGLLCRQGFDRDEASRIPWKRRMEAGMDLAMQIQKDKNFPWQGCANVIFPLVTIASLQFGSRAYGNIIQGTDIAQYRVVGDDSDGELTARARRVSTHMSWQLLEEDPAWEEQTDRLLINVAIVGSTFKKSYFSSVAKHNVGEMVHARDLVINYWARSIEAAQRKTHIIPIYRNEIYSKVKQGVFANVLDESWFTSAPSPMVGYYGQVQHDNRQGIVPPQADEDSPFITLEQHRLLDLDQDGYAEPYIVTTEFGSNRVLRIVSRWESETDIDYRGSSREIVQIRATEYFTKYGFIPAPDGGIYDMGFGCLLGPINEAVNTAINQMLDAGTMSNSNGGFLGRGAKLRGGAITFAPWQWVRVDSTGDDLRKSMVPFPTRDPSSTMFQLLSLLITYADRLSGSTDAMVGENPGQNTKTGTFNATIEQGMEVYSNIFKRIWRSMKEEFKKYHMLNRVYLPLRQNFGSKGSYVLQEDYKSDPDLIVPAADRHIVSKTVRVQLAMTLRQAAHSVNGYDIEEVERNFLRALGIDSIEKFYPGVGKTPPLPNPKVQVEEMKLKAKMLGFEHDKWKTVVALQAQRRETEAKITLLEAQALNLMHDMDSKDAALRLEAFETTMTLLREHAEVLNQRIELLQKGSEDGKPTGSADGNPQSGGPPGMDGGASNPGVPGLPASLPQGANGAMG